MPAIVAPNEGLDDLLYYVLGAPISGVPPLQLGLFVNDITPDQNTVFMSLAEPSWSGYSRYNLYRDQWTTPVIDSDHAVSTWTTTPLVFLNASGSPETVYGVFMLDAVAGVLRFIQRFDDGDIRSIGPGDQLTYLPRITLTTEGI